ncbi:sodium:proton antiporter [Frigidibacter sp. MR17.14]|uniref:cation:proton antiporter n=1 Tax=Frigidibacter sp. MR17.14 TaxID=3126509 RepID=UPI003012DB8D
MMDLGGAGIGPILAFALVGALGVGSQWLAWRLRLPGIVVMLVAGLLIGPALGLFDPQRDIGDLTEPMIQLAVAVILFEGGLTLDLRRLGDAKDGVRRLVLIGAPLGWLLSALALHYGAGLGWETSAVFGGIMIVTGPTVIAPLLRQARIARRPANLLQWEAIVNDPIGALAAVLAFEIVTALATGETLAMALAAMAAGIVVAAVVGLGAGWGLVRAFRKGWVPEYMKVPVLFVTLLATFALSNEVLHESGLLTVTLMGFLIANADLPSHDEIRRFKEQATLLLVSGVFILLAAGLDVGALGMLDWRAAVFVALVVLLARPLTVMTALAGSRVPRRERWLLALTGPRGVVLVAVAGLFGQRLVAAGVEDGAVLPPLAFVLVVVTVVLHGFALKPLARRLGLTGAEVPGVIVIGAGPFGRGLAETLGKAEMPVLIADPDLGRLASARRAGLPAFYGDILSEAAEDRVELLNFESIVAVTGNDAYNSLVAAGLGPEFGREKVWQVAGARDGSARHARPAQLSGLGFAGGRTLEELEALLDEGARFRLTRLTEAYGLEDWHAKRPNALPLAVIDARGRFSMVAEPEKLEAGPGDRILSLLPPGAEEDRPEAETSALRHDAERVSARAEADRAADRRADCVDEALPDGLKPEG